MSEYKALGLSADGIKERSEEPDEAIKPISLAAAIVAFITLVTAPFYIKSSMAKRSDKDYGFKGVLSDGTKIEYGLEKVGSTLIEKMVYTANGYSVSVIDADATSQHPNLDDAIEMAYGENWDVAKRYDGGISSNLPYEEAMKRFREAQDIFLRAKEELGISKRLDELMQNAG